MDELELLDRFQYLLAFYAGTAFLMIGSIGLLDGLFFDFEFLDIDLMWSVYSFAFGAWITGLTLTLEEDGKL